MNAQSGQARLVANAVPLVLAALDLVPFEGDDFAEAASGSAWCSCKGWSCGAVTPKLGNARHDGQDRHGAVVVSKPFAHRREPFGAPTELRRWSPNPTRSA